MKFRQQNTTLGLDVGQSYARLVQLKRSGKKFTIERAEELNIEAEGILDEEELYSESGLGKWLKEKKLDTLPICLGLPQYLCTTRNVNDFMANAKQEQFEQMVQFETTQLAGLSEETFLSDYQRMSPAYGIEAPIIIGFGRETGSDELAAKCAKIPIHLADLAMGSFALANAFCYLHPEELSSETPQVIIDLGTENSTIVIMVHGNVVYTGSMMFGGKRFTQVLAATMECSEAEAEKLKQDYVPDWDDNESPYIFATRQLETELRTSIENWRSGEIEALSELTISKMWLCGGAARTIGLAEHLERIYGCPVELLGPTIVKKQKSSKDKEPANSKPAKQEKTADTKKNPEKDEVQKPQNALELQPEAPAQDDNAATHTAISESQDGVPEGLSNIFSSMKIKVHVPSQDNEDETLTEVSGTSDGDGNSGEQSTPDTIKLVPNKIKVTMPLSEDDAAIQDDSPTIVPPDEEASQIAPKINLEKRQKPIVKATSSPDIAPEFTLAFGLALQTTGNAAYPISLAPRLRRWQIQREERLKYLVLAVFFLFATIAGSMLFADYWLGSHIEELNEGMDELRECDKVVPKLDSAMAQIEHQQKLLLPFVELGSRSKTFMQALTVINEAKGPNDWCFYFADQYSYAEQNEAKAEEPLLRESKPKMGDMFSVPTTPQPEKKPDIKDEQKVVLDTMPLLTSLVMAGFTPVVNNKRYAGVVQLQGKLRASKFFTEQVDTIVEEWQGNGINLETGWNQYLKNQKKQHGEIGDFTEFKLSLPLAQKQVVIPETKAQPQRTKKK